MNEYQAQQTMLAIQDREAGRPCVIVCTGPELNKTPPEEIDRDQFVVIGMNNIWIRKETFVPDYWIAEDVQVISQTAKQIREFEGPIKLLPQVYADWANKAIPFYINYGDEDYKFSHVLTDLIGWGSSVTFCAFQLALWLGCKDVYLIGAGPGYTAPPGGWQETTPLPDGWEDPNHFDPNYYGAQRTQHMPRLDRMERSFTLARDVFTAEGGRIVDCTPVPVLDIFEKGDWECLQRP